MSVSTATPRQPVCSFDHFVTQWMSTVTSSYGSAVNCAHVHFVASPVSVVITNSHRSVLNFGVGPGGRAGEVGGGFLPGRRVGPLRPPPPAEPGGHETHAAASLRSPAP